MCKKIQMRIDFEKLTLKSDNVLILVQIKLLMSFLLLSTFSAQPRNKAYNVSGCHVNFMGSLLLFCHKSAWILHIYGVTIILGVIIKSRQKSTTVHTTLSEKIMPMLLCNSHKGTDWIKEDFVDVSAYKSISDLSESWYHVMVSGSVSGKILFIYPCMQYGPQVSMLCFETKRESRT